ncbi:MAG: fatty acid desaturase [Bryobacteraceae bacterium]
MSLLWMIAITLVILQMSVFCTTIYLHRTKTHKGLELNPVVGLLMHLELTLFTGVVPRQWAAVHRKHHHFSDEQGDPHSPYIYGMWTVLFGNYFMYRKEARDPQTIRKYTPDWKPDVLDRIPGLEYGALGGLAIFMLMFGVWWGLAAWWVHVIGYILLNSSINSICHMVGYRNFDNKATNLQSIALVTAGEGLHNNHHQYPTSALFAVRRGEIDLAWGLIRALETFGLAKVKPLPMAKAA